MAVAIRLAKDMDDPEMAALRPSLAAKLDVCLRRLDGPPKKARRGSKLAQVISMTEPKKKANAYG